MMLHLAGETIRVKLKVTMIKVLDLFCGPGGASVGLHNAGFEDITGVDFLHQKFYPFKFIQKDVNNLDVEFIKQFNLIWASPPCKEFSKSNFFPKSRKDNYPQLIPFIRDLLTRSGKPFCIENVAQAPVRKDLLLCGSMFHLGVIRHRVFEFRQEDVALFKQPVHPKHTYGCTKNGEYVTVSGKGDLDCNYDAYAKVHHLGNISRLGMYQQAMGITWVMNRNLIVDCVVPAYAWFIGSRFIDDFKRQGLLNYTVSLIGSTDI